MVRRCSEGQAPDMSINDDGWRGASESLTEDGWLERGSFSLDDQGKAGTALGLLALSCPTAEGRG
jgi:hypothetical protein